MIDLIIASVIIASAVSFVIYKIIKTIHRPAGSSSCTCNGGNCSDCNKIGGNK